MRAEESAGDWQNVVLFLCVCVCAWQALQISFEALICWEMSGVNVDQSCAG